MSILQLKREGWFEQEDSIELDLNETQKTQLKETGEIIAFEKGSPRLFKVKLIPSANLNKLDPKDIRIELLSGGISSTNHAVYIWINGEKTVSSRGSWHRLQERDIVRVGSGPEREVKVSDRYFIGDDLTVGARWQFLSHGLRPVDKPKWYISKDSLISYAIIYGWLGSIVFSVYWILQNHK